MIDKSIIFWIRSFVKSILFGPVSHVDDHSEDWSFFLSSVHCLIELVECVGLNVAFDVVVMTELQHFFHVLNWANNAAGCCDFVLDHVIEVDFELSCDRRKSQHDVNSLRSRQVLIAFVNLFVINEKGIDYQIVFSLIRLQRFQINRTLDVRNTNFSQLIEVLGLCCESCNLHTFG